MPVIRFEDAGDEEEGLRMFEQIMLPILLDEERRGRRESTYEELL